MYRNIRINIYRKIVIKHPNQHLQPTPQTPQGPSPAPQTPQSVQLTKFVLGSLLAVSELLPFSKKTKSNGIIHTFCANLL